uniref:Trichome birefringence-like C-terminal domain-containing protein n=1 Tax=Setaria viridis TaxID=4556 RepID=A0A4V6D9Z6_SETVI|nr:hypothetical protein SEVIR_3G282300v2 [Setaria viridis]
MEEAAGSWVPTEEAYGMAFRAMLQWVRDNMDLNTTRVFFTSMSPTHGKYLTPPAGELTHTWRGVRAGARTGATPGGNCYNETAMIEDEGYWSSDSRRSVMRVIREILDGDSADVTLTFLNVTQLFMYRKDAHTCLQVAVDTADGGAAGGTQDDTWNELLYSKLFYP